MSSFSRKALVVVVSAGVIAGLAQFAGATPEVLTALCFAWWIGGFAGIVYTHD